MIYRIEKLQTKEMKLLKDKIACAFLFLNPICATYFTHTTAHRIQNNNISSVFCLLLRHFDCVCVLYTYNVYRNFPLLLLLLFCAVFIGDIWSTQRIHDIHTQRRISHLLRSTFTPGVYVIALKRIALLYKTKPSCRI